MSFMKQTTNVKAVEQAQTVLRLNVDGTNKVGYRVGDQVIHRVRKHCLNFRNESVNDDLLTSFRPVDQYYTGGREWIPNSIGCDIFHVIFSETLHTLGLYSYS